MIRKIFIDASALYPFVDRSDPNHIQSVKAIEQLSLQGVSLYTSVQSVQETHSAISSQLGATLGFDFLQAILESNIEILYPQKSDLVAAFKLIKLNRNRELTLKESLTAVLMQRKNISQIITFAYWQNLLGSQKYSLSIF